MTGTGNNQNQIKTGVTVNVLGADELKQRLDHISKNMLPTVRKAMTAACHEVEREAKRNCTPSTTPYWRAPFQTGRLRQSITSVVEDHDAYGGREVRGLVGTNVDYALDVHDGTSKTEGRPFLLDAVITKEDRIVQLLRSAVIQAALEECETPGNVSYLGLGAIDMAGYEDTGG